MSFGEKKNGISRLGAQIWLLRFTLKNLGGYELWPSPPRHLACPSPNRMLTWRRVTVISRQSTKAWNDLGAGEGWLHGPMWSSWKVWFLLNPDMLAISTWSLTINQQPLWQSCVFQMTSFLRLPLKWSDSQGEAGAKRVVRHRLWNSSLLSPS